MRGIGERSAAIEVAFQLFACGMVWDGNVASKSGRDELLRLGYAVHYEGMQALTGRGAIALLLSPRGWWFWFRSWRTWRVNRLVASPEKIRKAMS